LCRDNALHRGVVALLRGARRAVFALTTTKHADSNDTHYDPEEGSTATTTTRSRVATL
jgi:hypothetical protein